MNTTRTTSMVSPLVLRKDLERATATDYWAHAHAAKVEKLPNIIEYNQRHFSDTDHGYWPATESVGTRISENWQVDGCSELRFTSVLGALKTSVHAREVFLDEQNVFERVVGQATLPGDGRWHNGRLDTSVPHTTALWLRRRRGVNRSTFRNFVHEELAPALAGAGGLDVRAYTFTPYVKITNVSPGVCHDYPKHHQYHGALFVGANSRDQFDELVKDAAVAALIAGQARVITAAHAYTVERTVPVVSPQRL